MENDEKDFILKVLMLSILSAADLKHHNIIFVIIISS